MENPDNPLGTHAQLKAAKVQTNSVFPYQKLEGSCSGMTEYNSVLQLPAQEHLPRWHSLSLTMYTVHASSGHATLQGQSHKGCPQLLHSAQDAWWAPLVTLSCICQWTGLVYTQKSDHVNFVVGPGQEEMSWMPSQKEWMFRSLSVGAGRERHK